MEKADVIWNAELAFHRGPVDGVLLVSATVSCYVQSDEGPAVATEELMTENAINFVSRAMNEDPAAYEVISLHWSQMPFVDASELPPPAPEDAHGNH